MKTMSLKPFHSFAALAALVAVVAFAGRAEAGLPTPPTAANTTIDETTETFGGAPGGRYSVTVDNSGNAIIGFAVVNNSANSTSTTRPDWSSSLVSQLGWDGASINPGNPGDGFAFGIGGAFKTDDIVTEDASSRFHPTFTQLFGPGASQAAFYFGSAGNGNFLFNETDNRFTFLSPVPASRFVTFVTNGQGAVFVAQQGTTNVGQPGTTTVPEPGALGLFGIGVIGLGFAVRRRRTA